MKLLTILAFASKPIVMAAFAALLVLALGGCVTREVTVRQEIVKDPSASAPSWYGECSAWPEADNCEDFGKVET